jgi:hypothetical protein
LCQGDREKAPTVRPPDDKTAFKISLFQNFFTDENGDDGIATADSSRHANDPATASAMTDYDPPAA